MVRPTEELSLVCKHWYTIQRMSLFSVPRLSSRYWLTCDRHEVGMINQHELIADTMETNTHIVEDVADSDSDTDMPDLEFFVLDDGAPLDGQT